jgi:hypothetical protein
MDAFRLSVQRPVSTDDRRSRQNISRVLEDDGVVIFNLGGAIKATR